MENSTLTLIDIIAWPFFVTIVIVLPAFLYFRNALLKLLNSAEEVKVFGVEIKRNVDDLSRKVDDLDKEVYSVIYSDATDSKAEIVRDQVWRYMAFISEKLPEQCAFDLRKELNVFHLENMRIPVKKLKHQLNKAGYYEPLDPSDMLDEEITPDLVNAIMKQQAKIVSEHPNDKNVWVDGVVGPHTWARLTGSVEKKS